MTLKNIKMEKITFKFQTSFT